MCAGKLRFKNFDDFNIQDIKNIHVVNCVLIIPIGLRRYKIESIIDWIMLFDSQAPSY